MDANGTLDKAHNYHKQRKQNWTHEAWQLHLKENAPTYLYYSDNPETI